MVLDIESRYAPFSEGTITQMAQVLPDFIATRRWYRSKARRIQNAEIQDILPVAGTPSYILVVRILYGDGDDDQYMIALTFSDGVNGVRPPEASGVVATYREGAGSHGTIHDAFGDAEFRSALLRAVTCDLRFEGRSGDLSASRTSVFRHGCESSDLKIESAVSKAEQSNTSIVYGGRFILKVFRKLEAGINPDLEIGAFLTERGFKNTPAVLGKLEYRPKNGKAVYAAGILQEFVPNRGDAWKYTLEELRGFFERFSDSDVPLPESRAPHPMDLLNKTPPSRLGDLLGSYANSAHLLGIRTAQMHEALADAGDNCDFTPEPFTVANGSELYQEMVCQADITFELLRRKQAALADSTAEMAHRVLRLEHRIAENFSWLRDHEIRAARIRFHGDFHLGQVLYTGSDFMIIDFEGEPARPLNERRRKGLAMRDVAGMIRSFQYAAYTALFELISGDRVKPESMSRIEPWTDLWTAWISSLYLNAYFSAGDKSSFVPAEPKQRRLLLDAFILQKALYEVAYELNNRPDWVRIPLRGILGLIG